MRRACLRAMGLALALVLGFAVTSPAQTRAPRVEISGGGLFVGGFDAGKKNAEITANQTGGAPYTLFKSESRIDSAPAIEGRVGVRMSRLFTIEGGVFMARPQLATRLTGDVEGAPDVTAVEDLSMYIIDVALMTSFGSRSASRITPFVRVGGGYVRELHEDNALVKTGYAVHAGGGVTFWFNPRQTIGARADARVYFINGGIDLDGGSRTQGAGGGAIVFAF
jgi:hypothetical protein